MLSTWIVPATVSTRPEAIVKASTLARLPMDAAVFSTTVLVPATSGIRTSSPAAGRTSPAQLSGSLQEVPSPPPSQVASRMRPSIGSIRGAARRRGGTAEVLRRSRWSGLGFMGLSSESGIVSGSRREAGAARAASAVSRPGG